jgi:TonB family protein
MPRPSRARAALCFAFAFFVAANSSAHEPDEPPQAQPQLTAPQLLERVEPHYPEAARAAAVGGTVSLEIDVAADGSVSAVRVTKSAGFGFDDEAVEAAKQFKFRPATRVGKPIAATVLFDQHFVIRAHLSAETSAAGPPTDATAANTTSTIAPSATPPPTGNNATAAANAYESSVTGRAPMTAASSSTIRNQDFDLRPKTSPNDILRVVPGLLAVQHQGGGKADQIFLRGFDADHGTDVAIYIDGIPINLPSHAHGQGYADLHFLIPEALERIEVVKGPYDARFGDFATAGAVNIVTRDRFEQSSVQYTLGMFPTIPGRAAAEGRFVAIVAPELPGWASKLHPWVAFEAAYDDGPFTASEDLKRYNLFSKISYDVSREFKLGVFISAYGSGWIGSGQIPQRDVPRIGQFGSEDPSEGGLTERQMFTLFARYRKSDQELDFTAYVTRYRLALFNDFTFFLNDPLHGDEIEQDDARVYAGGKVSYHFHRRWRSISFRTTLGADMRYDSAGVQRWNAESQDGDFRQRLGPRTDSGALGFDGSNDAIDILNMSGFAEEDVRFNRYFRLIGGLRADYFGYNVNDLNQVYGAGLPNTSGTRQFDVISPKASAVISPIPDIFELYLNYGSGFHSNMAQAALLDGKTLTNSDGQRFTLHAIPHFYGGEIGARGHLWNRLDLAAAFWMSYLENETVFDADSASFVPSAPTKRLGFDFELRAMIASWLYADFDLAQANATSVPNAGNGGAIALAPKLYMTGGISAKHRRGIRGGLRFRYLGARPAFDETSPEYQYFTSKTLPDGRPNPDYDPSRVIAQGYFILDMYGAYRWRFLEASFAIQNLLNSTWREAQFGNRSCTRDEVYNPANKNYAGSGNMLSDGTYVDRCGLAYANVNGQNQRSGVVDVHFTPGVPFNLQLTLKAYF